MKLESLIQYIDGYLGVAEHPDYPVALNGLQVAGPARVGRIATAVDASEAAIREASEAGADLLIVHHGLFWGGLRPLTGPTFRRVAGLIEGRMALYACHLPLDGHPEVGNCALLARALGVEPTARFAAYKGTEIGWWGRLQDPVEIDGLTERVETAVGGPVQALPGGPDRIVSVGVVTGGGASFIGEAVEVGLDALVTGEAAHHNYFDAVELGIHVLLAGHYRTEVFGVRALGEHLRERFDLDAIFLDLPTGL